MKIFNKQAAQGDVMITQVQGLPDGLKKSKPEKGVWIVTHSETGHNHVIDEDCAVIYDTENPLVSYLEVLKTTSLRHLRTFRTHEEIQFQPGTYRINRQREYVPQSYKTAIEKFRRVAD